MSVFAVLALAACASPGAPPPPVSSAAPAGPRLPARPAELRLDGLDPCGLLTPAQRVGFGLDGPGSPSADSDRFGSLACQWLHSSLPPYGGTLIRLVITQGAEYYLGSTQPTQVVDIGGFAAVQTSSAYLDPERGCLVLVDAAPGQTLWIQYSNDGDPPNGITHELACAKAREGAQAVVHTLREHLK